MKRPEHYEADLLFYFDRHPIEFSLYQSLFLWLEEAFPSAEVKVQKSQISFYDHHLFLALSLPLRRKKDWPKNCLLVTFGLGEQILSPRIAVATEPYPGRWTHHVLISQPSDLDEVLFAWLRKAHTFALQKGRKRS